MQANGYEAWQPLKEQRKKKKKKKKKIVKIYFGRFTIVYNLLFCSHTLYLGLLIKTFS